MRYFGLLGLLLGPLALVYFVELVRAYDLEFHVPAAGCVGRITTTSAGTAD
jgi:predicted PurR-regulated permease PerM